MAERELERRRRIQGVPTMETGRPLIFCGSSVHASDSRLCRERRRITLVRRGRPLPTVMRKCFSQAVKLSRASVGASLGGATHREL